MTAKTIGYGCGGDKVRLTKVPHGIKAIVKAFGDPEDQEADGLSADYIPQYTTVIDLPFPLRLSWRPEKALSRLRCHKKVGASLVDALAAIRDEVGAEWLERERWDFLGGCFHYRKMVGYDALSTHSWGIAIDLNPHRAGYGARPSTQLPAIVRAFKARGWDWGGDWPPKYTSDPMHFQACTGY